MDFYKHQTNIIKDEPWRVGLFLGTGSGKTRTAVCLSSHDAPQMSLANATGKTLVICKKTQVEDGTWTDEWAYQGKDPNDLTIVSKDQIKLPRNQHITWQNWDTIIGDEAHTLAGTQPSTFQKNYKLYPKTSIIYEVMKKIIDNNPKAKIYLLTATPAPQPMTVFGIGTLLGYKWRFSEFRDAFYFEKKPNIWLSKTKTQSVNANMSKVLIQNPKWREHGSGRMSNAERWELAQKISTDAKKRLAAIVNSIGYVGRLEDWFDVPEQIYKVERVATTLGQNQCFQELKLLYPDPLVQLGKRRQLEQGVFEGTTVNENKTEVIERYLNEYGKVAAFCKFTMQIDLYKEKLQKKGIKVFIYDGRMDEYKEAVKYDDDCVLLIQNQMSEGYNLINDEEADKGKDFRLVMFMTPDTFKDYDQGKGRVQRVKRIKSNLYVSVIAGKADEQAHMNVIDGEDFNEEVHAKRLLNSKKL